MPSAPPDPCIVVSDLHLFSRRSEAPRHAPSIRAAARRASSVVLAGDIVDFRWSRLRSVDATADAARRWLTDLLREAGDGELHYILGNHDHVPALVERLEQLAAADERFFWHPFHLRLGNAVFLHGDASHPRMSAARLHAYRERFARLEPPAAVSTHVYDWIVAMRLHVLGAKLAFPRTAVLRRLTRYLDEVGAELTDGVRNVYFGHTHLALDGEEFAGRRFHNCGAPMRGLDFRIVEADLT